VRAIAVKCDLCSFDEDGPACVRTCPTKALRVVDNNDLTAANRRKRQLTLGASLGDLTSFTRSEAKK